VKLEIKMTSFAPGDVVVYPGHGVGKVANIESHRIGEQDIQVFVITFEQDRMTLRVPLHKVKTSGLRNVSTQRAMQSAIAVLSEPASPKKGMWNRRSVEYTAKINSGDPTAIAQVVRDLRPPTGADARERSHSERLLYEQALGRLTHEFAAVKKTHLEQAVAELEQLLNAA
jgi:CarD family transcriptional regulator